MMVSSLIVGSCLADGLEFLPCRPVALGFGLTGNEPVPETTMLQWKKIQDKQFFLSE
ncbi:hypothetical protein [Beijerinckia mobilis]|uniref:hypothetical protein n=1 Tax=Beijerinckia mobilis TaxID=231434 RepID=UPI0012EB5C54|nr:hypothetical protein [Beijerinckia mobilis]